MRITCPKEILADKLQAVLKTITTKSAMPVLSGIRIRTAGETGVELASTNMELSLRLRLEAAVEGEGAVVVPGRLLADIVRSLPAGDVNISVGDGEPVAEVTSGQASFKINCLTAGDFPRLPEMPEEGVFEIETKPMVDTINTVAKAASRDETRPVLTGILVKFGKSSVKMVATDSYRLSVKETKVQSTLAEKKEVIVPRPSLEELARACAAEETPRVRIGVVDGQIVFDMEGATLTSRLVEGQFPNYQQLLPDEFKHEIELEREELLEVVGRIGIMAQKNAPLRMKFAGGELTVSAQTPQVGEASESLPVSYQGEEIEIGFNPEYFRDGVDSVSEDRIRLRIISPLRPGLVKGSGDDFLYLIMPVRLTG